ncbi:MAG: hypothetical protein H6654_19030 [Ardenticatenaceae bacterium]|nr:hypothetical protein [Anaerolineales bacterium]MCB8938296.1 hypothetical protein [Ardenticatenaceae bacterium]MCB8975661.1 hypothetical protein [Ardenticatenaceae bacterium]
MKKLTLWSLFASFLFGSLLVIIQLLDVSPPQTVWAQPTAADCIALPAPSGNIVNVSTVSALENAVNNASSGDTILIADGTYTLNGVYLRIDTPNVTLRSASGNRVAVVLDGNYITTEIIQIVASNVTVADVTLREAYYHPIHVMTSAAGDTVNTLIYNVHLIDPGEQAIKINPAVDGTYPDDGVIACSHLELTDAGRPFIRNNCYTGGIDAHQAEGWTIRDNLIEGFWCQNGLSEHGIHLWRGCRDTLVERNTLRENARGIGFGLADSGDARTYGDNPCPSAGGGYVDHYGGIIRNNFVFVSSASLFASEYGFDCGICLWQACGAQIFNNTVVSTQAPFSSIEWRFDNTDIELRNNLVSHNLRDRGGTAVLSHNLQNAPLALFADAANGDLHLLGTATAAIDQAIALAEVSDDVDGEPRPAGAAPDIGADEVLPQLQLFGSPNDQTIFLT